MIGTASTVQLVLYALAAGVVLALGGLALLAPRVLIIARRDVRSFFASPIAYLTLFFYALLVGNAFYFSLPDLRTAGS